MNDEYSIFFDPIFSEQPASKQSAYVPSVSYADRRSLIIESGTFDACKDGGSFPESFGVTHASYGELPNFAVHCARYLGPYECNVLVDACQSGTPLVVYRGGTGSGKSSLVSRIKRVVYEYCKETHWDTDNGIKTFIIGVSHRHDAPLFKTPIGQLPEREQEEELRKRVRYLVHETSRQLETELKLLAPDGSLGWEKCVASIRSFDIAGSDLDGIARTLFLKLQSHIDELSSDLPSSPAVSQPELQKAIEGFCDTQHEELMVWIMIFGVLAKSNLCEGERLVVAIDNIDEFDTDVQREFIEHLKTSADVATVAESPITLALFVRLALTVDAAAALPFVRMEPHTCILPSEAVYVRLTDLLLAADLSVDGMYCSSNRGQRAVSALLHLWLLLAENRRSFAKSLDSLGGTNLRATFRMVRTWLRWRADKAGEIGVRDIVGFKTTLRDAVGEQLCNQLTDSMTRVLQVSLMQEQLVRSVGRATIDDIAGFILDEITVRYLDVLVDLHFLEYAGGKGFPRFSLGEAGRTAIEEGLNASKGRVPAWLARDSRLESLLAETRLEIEKHLGKPTDSNERPGRRIFAALAKRCDASLVERVKKVADERGIPWNDISQKKLATFCKVFRRVSNMSEDAAIECAERTESYPQHGLDSLSDAVARDVPRLTSVSRFSCTKTLLESAGESRVLNVFAHDDSHNIPCGLVGLGVLVDSLRNGSGITSHEFARRMEFFGFSESESRVLLGKMMVPHCALAFAGVSDWHGKIGVLFDNFSFLEVRLTWAGFAFYKTLLSSPAYLQWAFDVDEALSRESYDFGEAVRGEELDHGLLDRVGAVRDRLAVCMDNELILLENRYEEFCDRDVRERRDSSDRLSRVRQKLRGQSATTFLYSADVFFRSITSFSSDLVGHSIVASASTTEADQICNELSEWVSTGESIMRRVEKLFRSTAGRDDGKVIFSEWTFAIRDAEHAQKRVREKRVRGKRS